MPDWQAKDCQANLHLQCVINTRKLAQNGVAWRKMERHEHAPSMSHSSSVQSFTSSVAASSIELHFIPSDATEDKEKEKHLNLVDEQLREALKEASTEDSGVKRNVSSVSLHLGTAGNFQPLQPSTVDLIASAAPRKLQLVGLARLQISSLASLASTQLESLSIIDFLLPQQPELDEFVSCLANMTSLKKLVLKPDGLATSGQSTCALVDKVDWVPVVEGVLSAAGQLPELQHLQLTLPESYAECEQHPLSWSAAASLAKLEHLQTLRLEARVPSHQRFMEVPTGALHAQQAAQRAENKAVASLCSTKLMVLELQGTMLKDASAWLALTRCPNLSVLSLGAVGTGEPGSALPEPGSLPALRRLRLGAAVPPRTLLRLLQAAPGLEELTIESGDCMVDFSISSAATAAKGALAAYVPAGVVCVCIDGIQGIPGSSTSIDAVAKDLADAAQLLQPLMAQSHSAQHTLVLLLSRPVPYHVAPYQACAVQNGSCHSNGSAQNGGAAVGSKVPGDVAAGRRGGVSEGECSSRGGSSSHSRKASEEEVLNTAGPSAAEMGALIKALSPLKGHLQELQLQRTSLGPKSLQALCTTLARALGPKLETLVLGFVHIDTPGLPAHLPPSVLSLRLESCTGMGASAGLLAPMVLHNCYTRRALQLSVVHHLNVAQQNSPDQHCAAEAEAAASTLAQVLPTFSPPPPCLTLPRLRGPLRGVTLRCHLEK